MHAGALDEALGERLLQLNALVHVLECVLVISPKIAEGTAHVIRKRFVLVQVAKLERLFEGGGSLGVTFGCLRAHGAEALSELALAALFVELGIVIKAVRRGLRAEALEVVRNKRGTGELLLLLGQDSLALGLLRVSLPVAGKRDGMGWDRMGGMWKGVPLRPSSEGARRSERCSRSGNRR